MKKQKSAHRKRVWKAFCCGVMLILGTGLFVMPKIRNAMHPVLYIKCEQSTLSVSVPTMKQGEVDLNEITLRRGEPVTLLAHGSLTSTVYGQNQTFTIQNQYLAPTLEQALACKIVFARRLTNLRAAPGGALLETAVQKGEPLPVLEASPQWLDRQTGEMRWYKVEKDGKPCYVSGTAVSQQSPSLIQSPSASDWASQLDLGGYAQPDWPDNPRLAKRSGIHVTLENLIKNEGQIVDYLKTSQMNTLVIALKGPSGQVWYDSGVPQAYYHNPADALASSQASKETLQALVQRLQSQGIYCIGRIETFQDSHLSADSPELALTNAQGQPVSLNGSYWLSPYQRKGWQYNVDLAKEAARLGFNEIQFDFCRFPDGRNPDRDGQLDMKNTYGETEAQAIQNFLYYAREELEPLHAYVGSDIFAGPVYEDNDYAIGQYYPAMLAASHVVSPMAYLETLQFLPENQGIEVFSSARDVMSAFGRQALARADIQPNAASVSVWIQGFGLMSPETLRAQMEGLSESGIQDILVWTDEGDRDLLLPLLPAFSQSPNSSTLADSN